MFCFVCFFCVCFFFLCLLVVLNDLNDLNDFVCFVFVLLRSFGFGRIHFFFPIRLALAEFRLIPLFILIILF